MVASNLLSSRRIVSRLSILAGNALQIAGIAAACLALAAARSAPFKPAAISAMIVAWILLYFSCHGIAHWLVGRLVGIRFAFYTIGGTGNPQAYPSGLRWIFEHLPFFGVQTEKASMLSASPAAKAIMWSAGVTSSAMVPTLGAVCAWCGGVPASKPFLIFAVIWALATLASNWTSGTGDFSKARRVLGSRKDPET
jgi:hypothetical protein